MRSRPLGKTGIEVSELGLGTWGLSGDGYGPVAEAVQDAVIDRALELGITLFDTADSYADGAMEKRLGDRLSGRGVVVTKVGTFRGRSQWIKRFDAPYLREAVEKSGERLRRSSIDVVLLHNPAAVTLLSGEATGQLAELSARGLLRSWGASVGDLPSARAALSAGAQVLELAHNLFFRRDLDELTADLTTHNAGILARSVLAHGLLTGLIPVGRVFPEGDHRRRRWTAAELATRVRQLDALRPLVVGEVHSLRAAALRYVLSNDSVSSAVLGPRQVPQLEQLVREAGDAPPYLPEAATMRLSSDLARVGVET